MGMTSTNILSDYKLINFNVPKYLIKNFDNLVRFKRVSRTSMLVHLMENYIRSEKKLMEDDNTLNLMINDVEKRNKEDLKTQLRTMKSEVEEEYEPPMIPTLNEKRSWSDHINDEDWNDISGVGFLNGIGR